MESRQQANEIAEKLSQIGKPQMEQQKQPMNAQQLFLKQKAMIKGIRITQSAQQILNKDAVRKHGEQINLLIGPVDGVVNVADIKFSARHKIVKTDGTPTNNVMMYNLPDVRSCYNVNYITLNNKDIRNGGNHQSLDRSTYLALTSRFKPKKLATNLEMDSYNEYTGHQCDLGQQDGYLVSNESASVTGNASKSSGTIGKVSTLNNCWQEDKLVNFANGDGITAGQQAVLPNLSIQSISKDTQKRLHQSTKHYRLKQPLVAPIATYNSSGLDAHPIEAPVQFEPHTTEDGDGQGQYDYQDYYNIRLGDLCPELESFKSIYMGGNILEIGITLLNKEECLTQIRKPITQRAILNETLTQTVNTTIGSQDASNQLLPYNDYQLMVVDTFLKTQHLLISDTDKLAFRDIQNMIGLPINRYTFYGASITTDGAFLMQQSVHTRNLIGVILFFRSIRTKHNANVVKSHATDLDKARNSLIKTNDFTHDQALQGNYGHMINHDHPCLPVSEIQLRIGGEEYTMATPPVKNQSYFQYMQALEGQEAILGAGNVYDVSFNEWRSNKCAYFMPLGKDFSGLDVKGKQIETTIKFQKEDNLSFVANHNLDTNPKTLAEFPQAGSSHFNRDVKQYEACMLYVHKDMIRFDKGFTELE